MSSGNIVQIIGAVIDVEFSRDSVPNVYDALEVEVWSILGTVNAHNPLSGSFENEIP